MIYANPPQVKAGVELHDTTTYLLFFQQYFEIHYWHKCSTVIGHFMEE